MSNNENKRTIVFIGTLLLLIAITVLVICLICLKGASGTAEKHIHNFGNEIIVKEASSFECGKTEQKCDGCDETIIKRIKATTDLPQIYLDGDFESISKTDSINAECEYLSDDTHFKSYIAISHQGHSSLKFEKKNYKIKFFNDEENENKNKISLNGWKKSNKYCLKANYIDYTQSRNIVSANIWSSVVASRKNLDKNIAQLEHYGAIDGYPTMVFINDKYQGVFTMNIPKDDDTYKIGNDEGEALFVVNNDDSPSAHFKALITDDDKKDKNDIYDLEYFNGDENWAYDSFNELISFVMQNDGKAFKEGIGKYLDVDSAIDYLICSYYLGVSANYNKNVVYSTYDGKRWILSMYDMDTAFGLSYDGSRFYQTDYMLPIVINEQISSSTDNLLFDKILINYPNEIKQRYFELRSNELNNEVVIKRFKDFTKQIPKECYQKELEIWNNIPLHNENNINQIINYINQRSKLLDEAIEKL